MLKKQKTFRIFKLAAESRTIGKTEIGDSNSLIKTNLVPIFMRMKEDHIEKSGQTEVYHRNSHRGNFCQKLYSLLNHYLDTTIYEQYMDSVQE
jgi:hypothetical protein